MVFESEVILNSLNNIFLKESAEHRRHLNSLLSSKSSLESDLARSQEVNAALVSEVMRLNAVISSSKLETGEQEELNAEVETDRKEVGIEQKMDHFTNCEFEKKIEQLRKQLVVDDGVEAQMKDLKRNIFVAKKSAEDKESDFDYLAKRIRKLEEEKATLSEHYRNLKLRHRITSIRLERLL